MFQPVRGTPYCHGNTMGLVNGFGTGGRTQWGKLRFWLSFGLSFFMGPLFEPACYGMELKWRLKLRGYEGGSTLLGRERMHSRCGCG